MRRAAPDVGSPLVLVAKAKNALRLAALDEAAEALGLEPGLPLSAARARVPGLAVLEADPDADRACLAAVGELCRRYTPAFALDPPDGAHLDITGCAKLFGGEAALTADLSERLRRQGFSARIGLARTAALAYALARHAPAGAPIIARDLPIAALRLDAESLGVLHRLGLRRVGQLLALPRPALARRLGEALLNRLDEALGLRAAAFDLVPEREVFFAQHRLGEPILLEEQILRLVLWLGGRLQKRLETRGVGGRRFTLELFRVDGAVKRLSVAAGRPLQDPAAIAALFAERFAALNDGIEAAFGFDLLRLVADPVEPLAPRARDLLGVADGTDLAALIDRLAVRLGPSAARRLQPAEDSLIPERAQRAVPPAAPASPWSDETPALYQGALLRPLTLFEPPQPVEAIAGVPEDPPQRLVWRQRTHRIVRAEGPERIAAEWRQAPEPDLKAAAAPPPDPAALGDPEPPPDRAFRDYYRIEDEEGRRFWVFREGAYGQGRAPRWFLHGLFP